MQSKNIFDLKEKVETLLATQSLIKIVLSDCHLLASDWQKCTVKPAMIKGKLHLSFTFKHPTKDITKNYLQEEALEYIFSWCLSLQVRAVSVFSVQEIFTYQYQKEKWKLHSIPQKQNPKPIKLQHDHQKQRWINENTPFLHLLGLSNKEGKIFDKSQDKFKQINEYIKLLSPALKAFDSNALRIVDMGSGKGYLTFALYAYLNQTFPKINIEMQGVELRKDLVDHCNQVAQGCQYKNLSFVEGRIDNFEPTLPLDVLIALHACDTATDDALAIGIQNQAQLIVVAPCCHKQIRQAITSNKQENSFDFLTRHGIFFERTSEMITDGMRALILEYFGYKVKVMQFISDAHTPKNVMIMASKQNINPQQQQEILKQIDAIKSEWGIASHHLEKVLP